MQGLFVTGTDTEVGKTVISTAVLAAWQQRGLTAAGYKPVAAGCDADGHNDDALALLAHSAAGLRYADVNPYALPAPKAPHLAAEEVGIELPLDGCVAGALALQQRVPGLQRVLVEGAGGWRVPLTADDSLADVAKALQWPVLLVVGLRLGCLNHALLTAEAIQADGLPLAGWVANHVQPGWPDAESNIAYLNSAISAPLLGIVPHQKELTGEAVCKYLNLPANL